MQQLSLLATCLVAAAALVCSPPAPAQEFNPQKLIAAETQALSKLAMLDGEWRGPASMTAPDGTVHKFTQTERIGPLLDGSIRLIEGRSYDDAGKTVFNAFAVLSFDPATQSYTMHSHAQGRVGDFKFVPTADGYHWEIPAGPVTIRYTATIQGTHFHEIGERIMPGHAAVKIFDMQLTRVGDSPWPGANPVSPRQVVLP